MITPSSNMLEQKIEKNRFSINRVIQFILIVATPLLCPGCKKGFLDAKSNQSFGLLNSIKNIQAILDDEGRMNSQANLKQDGTDEFYLTTGNFNALSSQWSKNIYIWAPGPDFYAGNIGNDWNINYARLFDANSAIEEINKIVPDNLNYADWANVKGSALFFRAWTFYDLAQMFCKPYISTSATSDPGILLRLSSDINLRYSRSTVQQTYDQILKDLLEAKDLLPVTPLFKTRPSKPAAFAMLTKTYLLMQDYERAFKYADSCLQLFNALLDYRLLDTLLADPMPYPFKNNPELIFYGDLAPSVSPNPANSSSVDSVLFSLYDVNDLRRTLFFHEINNRRLFSGSYLGNQYHYCCGIASDEVYLIRAECNARRGNATAAMDDLNTLLRYRWKPGTYLSQTTSNADSALVKILLERRRELCFRGLRWTDLRRLNLEDRFQVTLVRDINGQTYMLPPKDGRYVYPIPESEVLYNNITQNPR